MPRKRLIFATVALLLAASAAALLLPPLQTTQVAVPASSASPEEVARAYLTAWASHDCDTVAALVAPRSVQNARELCRDTARLSDAEVGDAVTEDLTWSGYSAPAEVTNVGVSYDLHWRPFRHHGPTEEAKDGWSLLLVRGNPDSAWRIFDEGAP